MSESPKSASRAPAQPTNEIWRVHAVGVGVCAALTALLYFAAIGPQLRHRQFLRTQQQELHEEQQTANKLSASLDRFRSDLDAVNRGIADHPLKLKTADQINQQLSRLTDVARSCGVELNEIQPAAAPRNKEHYDTLTIRVVGVGTFKTYVQFLQSLHREMPDIGVGLFELTGTPNAGATELKFVAELDWYMLPSTPATGSTASVPVR